MRFSGGSSAAGHRFTPAATRPRPSSSRTPTACLEFHSTPSCVRGSTRRVSRPIPNRCGDPIRPTKKRPEDEHPPISDAMRNNDAVAPQNGSPLDRSALAEIGHARAEELARAGVAAVALTWVDNVGVTRVKAVPVERFAHAAAWGVGMSTVHDVFQVDDTITSGQLVGGPVGDLRLHPD